MPFKLPRQKIIAFDIDGTLTASKTPITPAMAELIKELVKEKEVIAIAGGSFHQLQTQFLPPFLNDEAMLPYIKNFTLLPTSGTEVYEYDIEKKVWTLTDKEPLPAETKEKGIKLLEEVIDDPQYEIPPNPFGAIIEDRDTQITFTPNGQQAPVDIKMAFDPTRKKRERIKAFLEPNLPEVSIFINGTSSIDILPKDFNKATGLMRFLNKKGLQKSDVIFVGDGIWPGGNDYSVLEAGFENIPVKNPGETAEIIRKWLGRFSLTRYEHGPILKPDPNLAWETEGVFNPGIIQTDNNIVMLYRAVGELESYISHLGMATSADGINFQRVSGAPVFGPKEIFDKWGTEDPRISKIDEDYYITYVALSMPVLIKGQPAPGVEGQTALLKTRDFKTFENLGLISPKDSDNKDIVLFPKKINGRYCMLHRPNFWDKPWHEIIKNKVKNMIWPYDVETLPEHPGIWIAWSDDLKTWTDHKLFMHASHHEDSKIGPGLPPIETPQGWLVIYHHVIITSTENSFSYSVRAALFDLNDPTRLIGKLPYDILQPEMTYETERSSKIVFPTGGFVKDDQLFVYYGASDKYVCLATGSLSELLAELTFHHEKSG